MKISFSVKEVTSHTTVGRKLRGYEQVSLNGH